jgi:hypothetical protein
MKNLFLLLFYALFSANANAEFLKDYEALRNTKNFNEPHIVAYCDSFTNKGGGIFVWKQYDNSDAVWGLIIPSNSEAKGNWIRQDQQTLNPDWFGATNIKLTVAGLPPTFRNLGYSEEVIRSRYLTLIPDISLDDTPDWAALQMACKLQEKGWLSVTLNPKDYYINRTIRLPETTRPSFEYHFQLEGNGAWLYSTNKTGFPFLYTMPKNQKMSQDVFCSRRFNIRNLSIKGNAGKGNGAVGIAIGGTFHSLLENIQLMSLDTGIVLRHAMSTEIYRCNAVNNYFISYYIGCGKDVWEGATPSKSGSNQSRVIASRTFPSDNQFAGVVIDQSSECRVVDFTLDGGSNRNVSYGVIINTGGTSTVKDGYVEGIHGETFCDSALIKFRGNGASIFTAKDLYVQMKGVIVELDAMNNVAQVNISNVTYLPPGSTFANKGNGAWDFTNVFGKQQIPLWKTEKGFSMPGKGKVRNTVKLM